MPTRIFCRSNAPATVLSRTCVKIAARGGNAEGRCRSSSLGSVRPKPEASSTKRGSWISSAPSAARLVTLGRSPLKSTAVISTSKRSSAPWRCASRGERRIEIGARHLEREGISRARLVGEVEFRESALRGSNTAPFLNWKLRAITASTMPASSSSSMLQASRLSPIEKRGNFWRSSTSTAIPAAREQRGGDGAGRAGADDQYVGQRCFGQARRATGTSTTALPRRTVSTSAPPRLATSRSSLRLATLRLLAPSMRSPVRRRACVGGAARLDGAHLHAAVRRIRQRRAGEAGMDAGRCRRRRPLLPALPAGGLRQLGDHRRHVQGLAVADQRHVELLAHARQADRIAQLAVGLDGLAIDAGDHVAGLDAGLLGGRAFVDLRDQHALRVGDVQRLGHVGRERVDVHA